MDSYDLIVVGAGLRGLRAALSHRRERDGARVLVVDAKPWPGDDVQSQRSNGFVCELGPFAFTDEELRPHLDLLARPPRPIEARESARQGHLFDGEHRRSVAVDPTPRSFATGCEELVQAYRRELDGCLRLGRPVTSVAPADDGGFVVQLGGEVATSLGAREVVVATPAPEAGRMLATFDPALAQVVEHARRDERAFVFLGAVATDAAGLEGYGIAPDGLPDTNLAEVIFCTEVFPNRALDGRALVRAETVAGGLPDDDAAVAQRALAELRRWTGTDATFGFSKVHRFTTPATDGVEAECRARTAEIAANVPGLRLEP